ncbi:MAG: hypothetical protein ACLR8S_10640 [Paraprevotella clara]
MSFVRWNALWAYVFPVCLHWVSIRLLPFWQQDVRGSLHPASCKRRENRVFAVAVREGRG